MTLENVKYRTLSTVRYLGDGFFYPFFALYLLTRSLTESRIGFILSIAPILAIVMNPIYSRICDNTKRLKIVLGITSILEGIAILVVGYMDNFYVIASLTLLIAIFGSCHYGLMDSLIATYSDVSKTNYSGIRMFGTLAYIFATSIGGLVIYFVNYQLAFIISCILFVISGVIYLILKDIIVKNQPQKENIKERINSYKIILKNKKFILFMVFYGFMLALIFSNSNFFGPYLETRGINNNIYGVIFSGMVLVEFITLMVLTKLKPKVVSPYIFLFIATFTLVIRLLPCYLNAPLWVVISLNMLRGFGYGFVLHVSYQYIISLIGNDKAIKGIMLCTLVYSILSAIFNNLDGWLIEINGYETYFMVNVIVASILLLYSFVLMIFEFMKKMYKTDLTAVKKEEEEDKININEGE